MSRRTDQRRAAIWALYQSDLLHRDLDESFTGDANAFTRELAGAVRTYQPELDVTIERFATGWSLARIAPLERAILRVALLEMTHPDAVPGERAIPPEGAIDEAVQTAKEYCGAEAPAFVNGLLGAALREQQGGSIIGGEDGAVAEADLAVIPEAEPAVNPEASEGPQ